MISLQILKTLIILKIKYSENLPCNIVSSSFQTGHQGQSHKLMFMHNLCVPASVYHPIEPAQINKKSKLIKGWLHQFCLD